MIYLNKKKKFCDYCTKNYYYKSSYISPYIAINYPFFNLSFLWINRSMQNKYRSDTNKQISIEPYSICQKDLLLTDHISILLCKLSCKLILNFVVIIILNCNVNNSCFDYSKYLRLEVPSTITTSSSSKNKHC